MDKQIPVGWSITYNPKPIPDRRHDWDFVHEDYDIGSDACGTAGSFEEAVRLIREYEEDCAADT